MDQYFEKKLKAVLDARDNYNIAFSSLERIKTHTGDLVLSSTGDVDLTVMRRQHAECQEDVDFHRTEFERLKADLVSTIQGMKL